MIELAFWLVDHFQNLMVISWSLVSSYRTWVSLYIIITVSSLKYHCEIALWLKPMLLYSFSSVMWFGYIDLLCKVYVRISAPLNLEKIFSPIPLTFPPTCPQLFLKPETDQKHHFGKRDWKFSNLESSLFFLFTHRHAQKFYEMIICSWLDLFRCTEIWWASPKAKH